jgi:hypothetical protein
MYKAQANGQMRTWNSVAIMSKLSLSTAPQGVTRARRSTPFMRAQPTTSFQLSPRTTVASMPTSDGHRTRGGHERDQSQALDHHEAHHAMFEAPKRLKEFVIQPTAECAFGQPSSHRCSWFQSHCGCDRPGSLRAGAVSRWLSGKHHNQFAWIMTKPHRSGCSSPRAAQAVLHLLA